MLWIIGPWNDLKLWGFGAWMWRRRRKKSLLSFVVDWVQSIAKIRCINGFEKLKNWLDWKVLLSHAWKKSWNITYFHFNSDIDILKKPKETSFTEWNLYNTILHLYRKLSLKRRLTFKLRTRILHNLQSRNFIRIKYIFSLLTLSEF